MLVGRGRGEWGELRESTAETATLAETLTAAETETATSSHVLVFVNIFVNVRVYVCVCLAAVNWNKKLFVYFKISKSNQNEND